MFEVKDLVRIEGLEGIYRITGTVSSNRYTHSLIRIDKETPTSYLVHRHNMSGLTDIETLVILSGEQDV